MASNDKEREKAAAESKATNPFRKSSKTRRSDTSNALGPSRQLPTIKEDKQGDQDDNDHSDQGSVVTTEATSKTAGKKPARSTLPST
jgi:hypothetical protein